MSRRKQARPSRLLDDEEGQPAGGDQTGGVGEVGGRDTLEEDPAARPDPYPKVLMCQRCQEQFTDFTEYSAHKEECDKKAIKHGDTAHSDPEDMVISEDDEDDDDTGGKKLDRIRRHRQDAANNNNNIKQDSPEENMLGFPPIIEPVAPSHVTLEALQNTKVAVAQFAATALANNADNETALQELAVLQSTLFTLQHQQVLQLQLINQLQHQLQIDRTRDDDNPSSEHVSENETENTSPVISRQPSPERTGTVLEPTPPPQDPIVNERKIEALPEINTTMNNIPPQIQPPLCSISSSLASTIITHNNDPPPLDEPNTLEMLQKRAQEVLDSASQGLLATNLADELAFRKSKGSVSPYDSKGRNEPFFKHRCRYCGKVFGSDSALQIHIRSHTGERPYKCNVCGSRFTTKGNLKVHFQRHSAKFPHIKMNPNPVPEHLDKYHPPLLAQLGQQTPLSPGGGPPHIGIPAHSFPSPSLSLYRPHLPAPPPEINSRLQPSHTPPQRMFPTHPLFIKREEQETPADLSKPQRSPSPISYHQKPKSDPEMLLHHQESEHKEQQMRVEEKITPKQEPNDLENEPPEQDHEMNYNSPLRYDECSNDSKYSNENMSEQRSPENQTNNVQEEPENLSNKSNSISVPLSISTSQRIPANFSFGPTSSPPSSTSSGSLGTFPTTPVADITKDPAIYTNLLPRPGSNDNSWESLIEVTKTSETSKLQQLVDNIEHKLSDPNQCVICHRVLSCKSALQMHYRTHTGERPFKCKICGRAFTTKGNLKTHMGVHRAKPPMRVLHQCPVCHKKFTNALVLQQHIRLHTGEPTDLTPEQIQAAEVKEYPGSFPGLNSSLPFLNQSFPIPGLSPVGNPNLPMSLKYDRDGRSEHGSMDDDDDDDDMSNCESQNTSLPPFSSPSDTYNINTATTPGGSHFNAMDLNSSAEDLCFPSQIPSSVASSIPNGNASPSPRPATPEMREEQSPSHQISASTVQVPRPPSTQPPSGNTAASSPTPSDCNSVGALDLTPRQQQPLPPGGPPPGLPPGAPGPPPSLFSAFLSQPVQGAPCGLMSSALSSLTSSVLTSTSFSPLRLAVGPAGNLGRGNTTCHLCFKTFACNSALEIHFRSHTKERPFKCTVCDRGFSTKNGCKCGKQRRISEDAKPKPWRARNRNQQKISPVFPLSMNSSRYASSWLHGNMKQHMLTHKIRDMPQHMFENKTPSQSGDEGSHLPPSVPKEQSSSEEQKHRQSPRMSPPPPQPPEVKEQPVKREPTETELPLPKRPISLQASKHLCQVCNKNFSSSSALQIHMRTHTGDKPFRCTVCQKAFTTKGNLKVHMGTHMWNNGASRRGRRMSLDLPPIPMTPKDSEFLQRRPDLFYPYLPAPFLNGMQKLNDMPPVAPTQNGLSPGKYGGLVGFGYPPADPLRAQASPPERTERPTGEIDGRPPTSLWDLHFERNTSEGPRDDLLPAGREGLAA